MHDQDPFKPFTLAPTTQKKRAAGARRAASWSRSASLAAKFKARSCVLLNFKWLLLAPKLC